MNFDEIISVADETKNREIKIINDKYESKITQIHLLKDIYDLLKTNINKIYFEFDEFTGEPCITNDNIWFSICVGSSNNYEVIGHFDGIEVDKNFEINDEAPQKILKFIKGLL